MDLSEERTLLAQAADADWLCQSDRAMLGLGRVYAKRLDRALDDFKDGAIDNTEVSQTEYMRPHLVVVLQRLGFTPLDLQEIREMGSPVGERLVVPNIDDEFSLRAEVDIAVAAMGWRTRYDRVLINAACRYADRIDYATKEFYEGYINTTQYGKSLYLGPHLQNVLTRLGGAPLTRMKITGSQDTGKVTPIDELRRKRRERQAQSRPKLLVDEKRALKRAAVL